MKLERICLVLLFFILQLTICSGQHQEMAEPAENWLKEYNLYPEKILFYRFDRYSKEDVVKFREKLDLLKDAKFDDKWEGIYFQDNDAVGFSQLRWNSNSGFLSLYIYTCHPELRSINYGKVLASPDSIQLFPEFAENSPRKSAPVKYIKVKWSDGNYLVEESSLLAFAEKAAGIYVQRADDSDEDYQKWSNYWVSGNIEKERTGFPVFPDTYKKYARTPIETNIVSVGKRKIEAEVELDNRIFGEESAVYPITIGAGNNKGVKPGMTFVYSETGEEIFITQVRPNSAIGLLVRAVDENKNDHCLNDNGDKIACSNIMASQKVTTRSGKFWW